MATQIPITVKTPPPAASTAAFRGKKRPGSPAVSATQQSTGNSSSKKKKGQPVVTTATIQAQVKANRGTVKHLRCVATSFCHYQKLAPRVR